MSVYMDKTQVLYRNTYFIIPIYFYLLIILWLLAHLAFPPPWLIKGGRLRLLKRLLYRNHHSRESWFLLNRHRRHPAAFVGETRKYHTIGNVELY